MQSDSIGSRLIEARGAQSQSDFALKIGVHRNSLSRYESGENEPSAEVLRKIAELGYNVSWLLTGVGSMQSMESDASGKLLVTQDLATNRLVVSQSAKSEPENDLVFVKRYHVRLSAGSGVLDAENVTVDFLAFRRQFLEFIGVSPDKAAIVRVRGDSMEPALIDGDTVMIDTADTVLRPRARENSRRRAYAILQTMREGEALRCKFVECVRVDGSEITLISSQNPDYPDETPEAGSVTILGRIRWSGHTWF